MLDFQVDTMTCGGCAGRITRAVQAADPDARVEADVAARRVRVHSDTVDATALLAVLAAAGYPARAVPATPPEPARGGGCCCGSKRTVDAGQAAGSCHG